MKRILEILLAGLFIYAGCSHTGNLETNNYVAPTLKYQPKIFYPVQAQENFFTGITRTKAYVDSDGIVRKVYLLNSSGFPVLDSTAMTYCRNIMFNPALKGGKPIGVWLTLKIEFDVKNENLIARRFIHQVTNLYKEADASLPPERERIQKLILAKDSEFVRSMTDALNFNRTIEKVLQRKTVGDWKTYWDGYPLSFLLYYDFMQRFPDFGELPAVKAEMLKALTYDIRFIKNTPELESGKEGARERLLQKLQEFADDYSMNVNQDSPVTALSNS